MKLKKVHLVGKNPHKKYVNIFIPGNVYTEKSMKFKVLYLYFNVL